MQFARTAPLLAAAAAMCCFSVAAAPRDAKEKALVRSVDAGEKASIALLEQIVDVNSGTMNFDGIRKVGDMLRPRFEALGFKGYELLELKDLPGGVRTRRIRNEAKSEAPAIVTKLMPSR